MRKSKVHWTTEKAAHLKNLIRASRLQYPFIARKCGVEVQSLRRYVMLEKPATPSMSVLILLAQILDTTLEDVSGS